MDLAVAVGALLLIAPVELPDKTFVATLVLSTRYRPLLVWVGVGAAFAVQSLIAVTAGGLLTLLPRTPVAIAAAVLFGVGALVLFRGAARADEAETETEAAFADRGRSGATGLRVVGTSFAVLFLAEWGDLSQLLTAGLAAGTGDPVSVFAGAWAALLLVSGLAAGLGRALLGRVRLAVVQRVGAGVCAVLCLVTVLELVGMPLPR